MVCDWLVPSFTTILHNLLLGCIPLRRCGVLLQAEQRGVSVCLLVCRNREPCKNSGIDSDAVWDVDSGGPKEPYVRLLDEGLDHHMRWGILDE